MREIVLDTETTGLDPKQGHRIVEIGAVELFNKVQTGRRHHVYLDPQRDMPEEAFRVHGLSNEFLAGKPVFAAAAAAFLDFIGDAPLVIHNAEFDIRFLDHELLTAGLAPLGLSRAVDTLQIARRKHAGAPASLDALCARYGIDTSKRALHGALLDAQLLADVYLELCGGSQSAFDLDLDAARRGVEMPPAAKRPVPLPCPITPGEALAHAAFVATLGPQSVWTRYLAPAVAAAE